MKSRAKARAAAFHSEAAAARAKAARAKAKAAEKAARAKAAKAIVKDMRAALARADADAARAEAAAVRAEAAQTSLEAAAARKEAAAAKRVVVDESGKTKDTRAYFKAVIEHPQSGLRVQLGWKLQLPPGLRLWGFLRWLWRVGRLILPWTGLLP